MSFLERSFHVHPLYELSCLSFSFSLLAVVSCVYVWRDTDRQRGGGGGYLKLNCLHQNDFCIKMDSRESNLRRPFTCLPCKPLITIYKLNLY